MIEITFSKNYQLFEQGYAMKFSLDFDGEGLIGLAAIVRGDSKEVLGEDPIGREGEIGFCREEHACSFLREGGGERSSGERKG